MLGEDKAMVPKALPQEETMTATKPWVCPNCGGEAYAPGAEVGVAGGFPVKWFCRVGEQPMYHCGRCGFEEEVPEEDLWSSPGLSGS